ncbi:uncharacterized protein LOC130753348 [Actinidia eriantha]|uniref:uncharacterized protein LOC130753348 n=1 Tax=Actinidia eriantha TaxID=165200 RepID=UPI002590C076|nr:uncharacterized protein LOC130753348 [Actinidia eriantha]XP_057463331.1 uncharacterized protein LOC130753348 [Actinidia eriantha]XP_057463332.1 uncharacterized protein LOC130753348 [Actinidia eriantha]XP_057463333.1 uncharacterized protein LOC130753348 [Actinidia eriantha]XP_057463334.1 uncharacterized protein LOC130753348 [Actinidia eriantha]XP_057463336.1 uncharacterized protein LOC130753348 [Actinidia eriantha]
MDARHKNLGFAANLTSNAFKYLGKSIQVRGAGDDYCMDTILRLDSHGSSIPLLSAPKGIKRKWSSIDGYRGQQIGSSLCLRLGHSSSSSDSKGSSATACTTVSSAKETDEESSMDLDLDFSLHLGNEKIYSPKKSASSDLKAPDVQPKVDLQLSLSTGHTESDITSVHLSPTPSESVVEMPLAFGGAFPIDEGSTVLPWKTGNFFQTLHAPKEAGSCLLFNQAVREIIPAPTVQDLSSSIVTMPKSSVTCTSGITQQQQEQQQKQQRSSSSKTCQFKGCGKGARGASGLCIAHGGGRRCQKHGCHKGAEGRTVYCKAHGGGRRCEFLGCTKSAEGRTDFCIAHGGGRRCSHEGCSRAARGKSGLCIRHGGGKRCQIENCTKSAEGLSGLCISHGGGRRCQYPACAKGAQGSTMFCKAHGGGKRCTFEGCTKGAEGSTPFCKGHGGGKRCSFQGGGICPKSVHGGTLFCVAHGGGKRCAMLECTKSARGRTDFCVRHGGGKRCKFEGCGKSAQGSTDFCKAHGGGKRCSWGYPDSEFGQGDGPCNSFARGKTGLCTSHGALVQDKCVHGGATLGSMVQDPKPSKPEKTKEVVNMEDMNVDIMKMESSGVTYLGGPSNFAWKQFGFQQAHLPVGDGSLPATPVLVPEGRVHGGSLITMLTESSGFGLNGRNSVVGGPSEPGKSYRMPLNWM